MNDGKKLVEDTVEPLVRLASAVRELLAVIDAHDMDTLDCDRSGRRCCDCLARARKKVETCMPNARREFPAASAGKLHGVVGSLDSET